MQMPAAGRSAPVVRVHLRVVSLKARRGGQQHCSQLHSQQRRPATSGNRHVAAAARSPPVAAASRRSQCSALGSLAAAADGFPLGHLGASPAASQQGFTNEFMAFLQARPMQPK